MHIISNKNNQVKQQNGEQIQTTDDFSNGQGRPKVDDQSSILVIDHPINNRKVEVKDTFVQEHNSLNCGKKIRMRQRPLPRLDFSNLHLLNYLDLANYPKNEEIEKMKASLFEQMKY